MMTLQIKKLFTGLAGLLITISVNPVHADDIQIYEAISRATQATGDGDFNPNILFVLDNSGSMSNWVVTQTQENQVQPYDPDVDYAALAGFQPTTSYWVYDTNFNFLHRLGPEINACEASRDFIEDPANRANPVFRDRIVQWVRGRFTDFWSNNTFSSNFAGRAIECEDDLGNHGRFDNSTDRYLDRCDSGRCRGVPQYQNPPRLVNGLVFPYETNPGPERLIVSDNYDSYLRFTRVLSDAEIALECNVQAGGNRQGDRGDDDIDRVNVSLAQGEYLCERRLAVMKRVLRNVVNGGLRDPNGDPNDPNEPRVGPLSGVNIGLMRFNRNGDFNGDDDAQEANGGTLIDSVRNISAPNAVTIDPATGDEIPVVNAAGEVITNRDDFIDKLEGIDYELFTPLAESMLEAYRYFAGQTPLYSESSNSENDVLDSTAEVTGPATVLDGNGNSVANPDIGNYDSPIGGSQCQDNFVVLLSDGSPTNDNFANARILDLPGNNPRTAAPGEPPIPFDPNDTKTNCGDTCLDEVTNAMREEFGITSYTIAFAENIPVLNNAGDVNLTADNATELQGAFAQIIQDIQQVDNDNFVAPAVTVNAFNRLQNRSDIYYAVFTPNITPRWEGNIKKYRLEASDATIRDANNNNAIDDDTGFFDGTSKSFWSDEVDGPNVELGGFTAEYRNVRNLYVSLNTDTNVLTTLSSEGDANPVQTFKNVIFAADPTGALLGVNTSLSGALNDPTTNRGQNFDEVVRWSLGEDIESINVTDPPSNPPRTNEFAGESIHSTPYVLSYGTDESEPKDMVFVATNQGILHAITGQGADEVGGATGDVGGEEQWAYIPDPDLLENLGGYYNQEIAGDIEHIYGLDGEIAFDVRRADDNSVEDAKLFLGQRRGGNKYFAIDITNADGADPGLPVEKLWTIEGDSTLPAGTSDGLPRLGQSWARPIVTNFRTCDIQGCEQVRALVLGGGYDTQYDNPAVDVADLADSANQNTLGNAIYIVRAEDDPNDTNKRGGDVLWASSNSRGGTISSRGDVEIAEMNHSIPTPPTVLDLNRDGAIDAMFAVDLAGQVFRYDFVPTFNTLGVQTGEERTGGRIANLQENNVNRRFYNPIDAVFLPPTNVDDGIGSTNDAAPARIALVTGTGYRASPLQGEPAGNRYYVVYDENITGPQRDTSGNPVYDYVTVGNGAGAVTREIRASNIPALSTTAPFIRAGNIHEFGYFIPLEDQASEKIINPSLISSFQLIGVSYLPTAVQNNACSAAPGRSNAYRHDLLTGEQEIIRLQKPGVSAAPVLVFLLVTDPTTGKESLKPVVVIGTEPFDAEETFNITDPDLGRARKEAWWESGRANN